MSPEQPTLRTARTLFLDFSPCFPEEKGDFASDPRTHGSPFFLVTPHDHAKDETANDKAHVDDGDCIEAIRQIFTLRIKPTTFPAYPTVAIQTLFATGTP